MYDSAIPPGAYFDAHGLPKSALRQSRAGTTGASEEQLLVIDLPAHPGKFHGNGGEGLFLESVVRKV